MDYRIAICDDDRREVAYLSELVKNWAAQKRERQQAQSTVRISAFPSAEAFLFCYSEEKNFDILLLDIEMKLMNGVELAKQVRRGDEHVQIVFVTGYPDFIFEGYEVSALHYLMKPVSADRLFSVLDKAAERLQKNERRLQIVHNREIDYIPQSSILYIEAQKQFVRVCTDGGEYRMKVSLSDTEKQLDGYFFRCQRSFLVNLRRVVRVKSDCVMLENGAEVPISRGMAESIGKAIIRLF